MPKLYIYGLYVEAAGSDRRYFYVGRSGAQHLTLLSDAVRTGPQVAQRPRRAAHPDVHPLDLGRRLAVAAQNLRKLAKLIPLPSPALAG